MIFALIKQDYSQGDLPGGVQPPEILNEMAKENQQIASLQAQIQVASCTCISVECLLSFALF